MNSYYADIDAGYWEKLILGSHNTLKISGIVWDLMDRLSRTLVEGLPESVIINPTNDLYPTIANTLREIPFNLYYDDLPLHFMKVTDTLGTTLYVNATRIGSHKVRTLDQFDYVWYSEVSPYNFNNVSVLKNIEDVTYLEDLAKTVTIGDQIAYNGLMYQAIAASTETIGTQSNDIIILQAGNRRLIRTLFNDAVINVLEKHDIKWYQKQEGAISDSIMKTLAIDKSIVQTFRRPVGLLYNQLLDQLDTTVPIFGYIDNVIGSWLTTYTDELFIAIRQ